MGLSRVSHPSRPSSALRRPLVVASLATVAVIGAPIAALAAWPQFQGNGTHDGLTDGPTAPLATAWTRTNLKLSGPNTTGGLSAPVVADDGTVVVVAPAAVLGFSAADGSDTFSADRDFGPSSQPAIASGPDGPIVVFTEGFGDNPPTGTATPSPSEAPSSAGEGFDAHVNAVDLRSGDPVWGSPVQLEDIVQTPVAVDEKAAYVSDVGGTITAIDLAKGDVLWSTPLETPTAAAVTADGGQVLVATLGERDSPAAVVALDAGSGKELWRTHDESVSNLVSSPVVADGRILVLDALGGIVAFERDGGRLLWRAEVVNPRTSRPFFFQGVSAPAPVSADGQVFAVDVTGRLYALDAETGAPLWDHALNDPSPTSVSPPLLTGEQVLVPADSGTLYAVDRKTGHLVFRTRPADEFLRGLADAGDVLVGVTGFDDAGLVAFEADPGGVLIDEPSPTVVDLGKMLVGFALGGVTVAAAALLLARPLQRRLGPALEPDEGEVDA